MGDKGVWIVAAVLAAGLAAFIVLRGARASATTTATLMSFSFSASWRLALAIWPGYHWMSMGLPSCTGGIGRLPPIEYHIMRRRATVIFWTGCTYGHIVFYRGFVEDVSSLPRLSMT